MIANLEILSFPAPMLNVEVAVWDEDKVVEAWIVPSLSEQFWKPGKLDKLNRFENLESLFQGLEQHRWPSLSCLRSCRHFQLPRSSTHPECCQDNLSKCLTILMYLIIPLDWLPQLWAGHGGVSLDLNAEDGILWWEVVGAVGSEHLPRNTFCHSAGSTR